MNFIMKMFVGWAAKELSEDTVKDWAGQVKAVALPWVKVRKDELIEKLRKEAEKSDTEIDDVAVNALDSFLDAFIPDNTKCI